MKRTIKILLRALFSVALRISRAFRGTGGAVECDPKRIVFLAGNWIGDCFWALHAIRLAARRWPNAERFVLVKQRTSELFSELVPSGNRIIAPNLIGDRTREKASFFGMIRDIRKLRKLDADLLFDLMGNRYSTIFALCSGAKTTVGPNVSDEWENAYSVNADFKPLQDGHLILKPWNTVLALAGDACGLQALAPLPPFSMRGTEESPLDAVSAAQSRKTCVLLPGAGWPAKRWPPESYRILAQKLHQKGIATLVLCTETERERFQSIADATPDGRILVLGLKDAVSQLSHAAICVGGDTGLIHIAASFGMRTVGIYCPSNEKRSIPLGKNVRVLIPKCPLHPTDARQYCSNPPRPICRERQWMSIAPDEVLAACLDEGDAA